jgi:hypothetical protein
MILAFKTQSLSLARRHVSANMQMDHRPSGFRQIVACCCPRLGIETARPCILDGDLLRSGLNSDLNFANSDRAEAIRRTGEVALLMVEAGLVAIVSLISPFRRSSMACVRFLRRATSSRSLSTLRLIFAKPEIQRGTIKRLGVEVCSNLPASHRPTRLRSRRHRTFIRQFLAGTALRSGTRRHQSTTALDQATPATKAPL